MEITKTTYERKKEKKIDSTEELLRLEKILFRSKKETLFKQRRRRRRRRRRSRSKNLPKPGRDKMCRFAIFLKDGNTIVNIGKINGRTLYQVSAGKYGFKGAKRRTLFATEKVVRRGMKYCLRNNYRHAVLAIRAKAPKYKLRRVLKLFRRKCPISVMKVVRVGRFRRGGCRPRKPKRL